MKKLIISLVILVTIVMGFFLYFNRFKVAEGVWTIIGNQLDKEEMEAKQLPYGMRGKDSIVFWNEGKFQIGKFDTEIIFTMYNANKAQESLLKGVNCYKILDNCLYVISDEGYAVVDQNDRCKILVTVDDEKYVSGYSLDDMGEKHYISRYITDEHITYLNSYTDFSEKEKAVFKEMER